MLQDNFDFVFSTTGGAILAPKRIFYKRRKDELVVIGTLFEGDLKKSESLNLKNSSTFPIKQIQKDGASVLDAFRGQMIGVQLDASVGDFAKLGIKIK